VIADFLIRPYTCAIIAIAVILFLAVDENGNKGRCHHYRLDARARNRGSVRIVVRAGAF